MGKLRLIPDKDKVGCYAHDYVGTAYGSVSANGADMLCSKCMCYAKRGWMQAGTRMFWCNNCVIVMDADSIREHNAGAIGGEEVAFLATDSEVLQLVGLKDKVAWLHNKSLFYEEQIDHITKAILARG